MLASSVTRPLIDRHEQVLRLAGLNKELNAIGTLTAAIISLKTQYQKVVQHSGSPWRLEKLPETSSTLKHPSLILPGKGEILFSKNLLRKNCEKDSVFIQRVVSPTGAPTTQELGSKRIKSSGKPCLIGARSDIPVMPIPLPVKEIVIIAKGDYLNRVVEVIRGLITDPNLPSEGLLGGGGIASFPN